MSEPPVEPSAASATEALKAHFGVVATHAAAAPGRVNLIGEHTDYNDGFVLPMAIERYTVLAGAPVNANAGSAGPTARVHSVTLGETATLRVEPNPPIPELPWARYVQGVIAGCVRRGLVPGSFAAAIDSTIPLGAGLSSSAALEVATATLIEALCGKTLDPLEKALLCRDAEHEYAGVPCGIMDPLVSVLAKRDHLLFIDCATNETQHVPFDDPDVSVLVIDSGARHALDDGAYAERRAECAAAAGGLGVRSLRDVSVAQVEAGRARLDPAAYRRARHVASENARTLGAMEALRRRDFDAAGSLLYASHDSLRDDFEVSCPELDALVGIAREIGPEGGVLGARMTGGGFGGSTVWLVARGSAAAVAGAVEERNQVGESPVASVLRTRPAAGARPL